MGKPIQITATLTCSTLKSNGTLYLRRILSTQAAPRQGAGLLGAFDKSFSICRECIILPGFPSISLGFWANQSSTLIPTRFPRTAVYFFRFLSRSHRFIGQVSSFCFQRPVAYGEATESCHPSISPPGYGQLDDPAWVELSPQRPPLMLNTNLSDRPWESSIVLLIKSYI